MCEDDSPKKQYISMLASGTASSVAKASPGVVVSGLTLYGYSIETWISILTVCYLILMIIGSLPKVIGGLRYLFLLTRWIRPSDWPDPDEKRKKDE